MANTTIQLLGRGLRGESYGDTARRLGLFGILPTDTDQQVMEKINADAAGSAAAAEAAAGPTYPDVATGLAATPEGQGFAVNNGDGTVTVYLNDGGVAVEQRTLATVAYLASAAGAGAVGLEGGGTVQNSVRWVSPIGVDRTGAVDATAAIQAGIDAATSAGKPFVMGEGTFRCTGPIYITCDFDGSNATFVYPANYTGNGVVVSYDKTASPTTRLYRKKIVLPNIIGDKTGLGWASVNGSIAALAVNVMECDITSREIIEFDTGLKLFGYNRDCNYNKISVDRIFQCRDALVLAALRVDSIASCNQNTIIGGRFALDFIEGDRVPGTNLIRLIADGAGVAIDSNVFVNPSVEGSSDQNAIKGEAINGGSVTYNTFISPRLETGNVAGKRVLFDGPGAQANTLLYGYGVKVSSVVEVNGARVNSAIGFQGSAMRSFGGLPTLALQSSNDLSALLTAYPTAATSATLEDATKANVAIFSTRTDYKTGATHTFARLSINHANGTLGWGSGGGPADVTLGRSNAGRLDCSGMLTAATGLGVGNSVVATTPGTVVRKVQIFDASGVSLGFIPIYNTIT